MRNTYYALASSACLALAPGLYAQSLPGIPSSADSGRVSKQLDIPLNTGPRAEPELSDESSIQYAPKNADKITFRLKKMTLSGNHAYKAGELDIYFARYMGKTISLLDIYKISDKINLRYRQDGYLLTRVVVPPQNIRNGHVTIRVIEGRLNKIYINTNGKISIKKARMLKRFAKRLEHKRHLKQSQLERVLRLINQLPGVTARAIIMPSPDTFGGADLFITAQRKRFNAVASFDNRGNRYIGPLQVSLGGTWNGVFDDADSLGVRLNSTLADKELRAGRLDYQRMLNTNGLTLALSARSQKTRPGYVLKDFDVKGSDTSLSAKLSYPLTLGMQNNTTIYASLEARDIKTEVLGTTLTQDHLRVARIGVDMQNRDTLMGEQKPAMNNLNVEVSRGIKGFGASKKGRSSSQPEAPANFNKITASISREQSLNKTHNLTAFLAATAQYSPNALLSAESFGVGGESFGSAYDSSEITGDIGYAVRAEARYLVIPKTQTAFIQAAQPYAFVDYGKVHSRTPSLGQKNESSIASTGIGLRANLNGGFSMGVEVAQPLTKHVATMGRSKSPRVFFKITKTF